jgi:hypothetical protein
MGLFDRIQNEVEQRERMAGISPVDLLDLPDDERELVLLLSRRGEMSLARLAELADKPAESCRSLLSDLEERGFVLVREIKGEAHYRTYFGMRRRREVPIDIWASLSDLTESGSEPGEPKRGEDGDGERGGAR